MARKTARKFAPISALILMVAILAPILYVQQAHAANFNIAMVRLDRMAASTATTGTVCISPTTVLVEGKVLLTFPASMTVGALGTWTIDNSNTASWPGSPTPTALAVSSPSVTGQVVTFTSPVDLAVGTTYCFNWNLTTALSTGATTGPLDITVATQTAASAPIDSTTVKTYILATSDQVLITGTVNPTFSFSLANLTPTFAAISNTISSATVAPVATITTNARNGYVTWVKDATANNGALTSAGAATNIPSTGAVGTNRDISSLGGTGAFGIGVTVSGGTSSAATEYDGTTFSGNGGGSLSNNYRIAASSTGVASANTVTITPKAIASTTQAPASDYTDTLTIVAAGQF